MSRFVIALVAACSAAPPPEEAPGYPTEGELPVSANRLHFDDGSVRLGPPLSGGRGVALVDVDDDGWPDATITHSQGVRVLRGVGAGRFALWADLALPDARALAWADADGDGDRDLYVSGRGSHAYYVNDGKAFVDNTVAAGLDGDFPLGGEGASFGDLDGDGDLDLFLAFGALPPDLATGDPGEQGAPDRLYWNEGGRFVLDASGVFAGPPGGETFQGALFDADRDGDLDLFAVDDHRPDRFLRNTAGVFADVSAEVLPNAGTESTSIMGIDVADVDQDGDLDIYGTQREGDVLYRGTDLVTPYVNAVDKFRPAGAGDPTRQSTGWGVAVQDFDDDGDQDILRTSNFDDAFEGVSGRVGVNQLLEHVLEGGERRFVDGTAAAGTVFDAPVDGWGLATGDIDRDGDLDALVGVDGTGPDLGREPDAHRSALLLVNRGAGAAVNDSVRLRIRQPGRPNVFAVGATLDFHGQTIRNSRVLQAGQSYLSQHDDAVHVGLGPYERLPAVVVTWPGGHQTTWLALDPGEHRLERPADDSLNCCPSKTGCVAAPSASACLAAQGSALGLDGECAEACEAWRRCCPALPVDVCAAECLRAPPPAAMLSCLQGDCGAVRECTSGGVYVPGNGTGAPQTTDGACPSVGPEPR